ncbi:hypothetical protein [Actinoallomurus sp. NPDC052274]|uniref:hypothetical protein n=1 Tax=Actinoallomurus sp. NPDC052274 TaxID=3155420 RepID=UPI00343157F9
MSGVASFPPSYRHFLAELGSCEVDGTEFLGGYRTPAMGGGLRVPDRATRRLTGRRPRGTSTSATVLVARAAPVTVAASAVGVLRATDR